MTFEGKPEILPPRKGGSGKWLDDEHLDLLSHVLDDWFRVPGTSIRFGLEGIVGLIPGVGDVLHGIASSVIVLAAWLRGVPYVTLVRMLVNLLLDVGIGAIPFLGDVFDIAFKANRRNYALLTRHLAEPGRHTAKDKVFLVLIVVALFVLMAIPLLILWWLGGALLHALHF